MNQLFIFAPSGAKIWRKK